MARLSIHEARNRLSELVKRSEHGEEIVLTRHGRAVAKLTAVEPAERALGQAKGQIFEIEPEWWHAMTEDEAEAYYGGRY